MIYCFVNIIQVCVWGKKSFKVFMVCVILSMLFATNAVFASSKAVMGLTPPTTPYNWASGNPYNFSTNSNTSMGPVYTNYYFTGGHSYSFYVTNDTNPVITNAALTVLLYAKTTNGDVLIRNCGTIYPGQSLSDYISNASTASQYYLKFVSPKGITAVFNGYFSKVYKGE